MPDYNKLTVVKLREELVNRGLPKSGLKPALVSRLIESDAQIQQESSTTDAQPVEQTAAQAEQVTLNAPPPVVQVQDSGGVVGGANGVDESSLHPTGLDTRPAPDTASGEKTSEPSLESSEVVQRKEVILIAPEETSQDEPSKLALVTEPPLETLEHNSSLIETLTEQPPSGNAVLVEEILEKKTVEEPTTELSPPRDNIPLLESTQIPLSGNEILEDSRKRKRRSQSPPPLAIESAQKRARTEGSRPDVKLPEDMDAEELEDAKAEVAIEAEVAIDASMTDVTPVQLEEAAQTANDTVVREESMPTVDSGPSADEVNVPESMRANYHESEHLKDSQHGSQDPPAQIQNEQLPPDREKTPALSPKKQSPPATEKTLVPPPSEELINDNKGTPALPSSEELKNETGKTPSLPRSEELQPDTEKVLTPPPPQPSIEKTSAPLPNGESSGRHSPSDTRFKSLFAEPSKRKVSPIRYPSYADQEDRVVSPALHPATSALYIRNFMRPLHPDNLKDFLITLATPSGTSPSAQIITEFFLDPIRTHCLVGFDNTSAASRVRSSLQNRIWPNERSRRPLWVDFVPEEKLKKWIEVEVESSSSRGQSGKRWEVVYEEEEDGIRAYLQEAGGNAIAARPAQAHARSEEAGQGVRGAPSGPRSREVEPRPSQSGGALKPENGKSFQALDDLFQSTEAKPKLYYLPADKSTVNKRLDALDAGRGGGRGDEMRRYTFEENFIVDRGPEYGARGRGGHGGRGGGGGGGGGGYGGGFYGRGRGYRDNWRDRR
ncbi:hypothetical protein MMC07_005480 [Pseudocyphellaria aurata]|nr:hypothetical protein [Pseudocyphellaria aurata]